MLWILVAVYLGVWALGLFFADGLLFQPQRAGYRDGPGILKLPVRDGATISARHLPRSDARFTILFSHGNAEDIGDVESLGLAMNQAGFSVFLYDYRGYGTSQGRPSEANATEDIEAAYQHLTQKLGVPPQKILLHGRSLGGAFSVRLAARRPVAGLILESTFVSAFRVLTRYPIFPIDRLQSIRDLPKIHCPILVLHGKNDEIIPFWHGEMLFQQANPPKSHLWVERAGHNDLELVAGSRYLESLQTFARSIETEPIRLSIPQAPGGVVP